MSTVDREEEILRQAYQQVASNLPEGFSRKDFALAVAARRDKASLFQLLDERDIRPRLLAAAKPEALSPSGRTLSEDDA